MIENCITANTNILDIYCDELIEFNTTDQERFEKIAEVISNETGVPKYLIYNAPYLFFINHWHKINGIWNFFKSDGYDFHFINELLGEEISEYFSLDTIHYKVARLFLKGRTGKFGVVSQNFCEVGSIYKIAWDYNLPPKGDLSVLQNLRQICLNEQNHLDLLSDMKRFFVRDFFTSQLDRDVKNFLFKDNNGIVRLAPLYDYENSFESIAPHIYRNQIATMDITNKTTQQLLRKDITFQELFDRLMQLNMRHMISKVEDRHGILISDEYKSFYNAHGAEKKELVLKNKLI